METNFNIMRIKDFAKQIGISENTIRTWKRRGNIPPKCFLCVGGTVFVKVKAVQQWIEEQAA